MVVDPAFPQTWTQTNAPAGISWLSVASSADGSKWVVSGTSPQVVYTSTNSGMTWTSNSLPRPLTTWNSIALSADGSRLVGVTPGGAIYLSTNSGATWLQASNAPVGAWFAVASSADGTKLVAGAGGRTWTNGPICISTDSGSTWTQTTAPIGYWHSVSSSADGTKLAAVDCGDSSGTNGGSIYISTNSGGYWFQASAPTNLSWSSVTMSADGSKLAAVSLPMFVNNGGTLNIVLGLVYTSTDSGGTWRSNNVPRGAWVSVASSADGSKLVAAAEQNGPNIFTSTNFGATWMSNSVPDNILTSVASSADGSKLVAVTFNGGIYTSQSIPAPLMNIALSSSNLDLSWLVPSTNFELQQNSDLSMANWVTVTNTPMLNLTNLQNEVVLSPTDSSGFFRLKTP